MSTKKPSLKLLRKPDSHTETRSLQCELSQAELLERGKRQATLEQERTRVEEEKKSTASTFSARIKTLAGQITELADVVASGKELRKVDVRVDKNYKKGLVQEFRTDGDEDVMINERKMTNEERQMGLPVGEDEEDGDE